MLAKVLKNKHLSSLLITITYCLFILPINESIAFHTIGMSHRQLVVSYLLKCLFAIFLYSLIYFALNFTEKIRQREKRYTSWLKITLVYLSIISVFFLLIYPGYWVWDEFNILSAVKQYSTYSWQNYFTNIYYTVCLYIIPTGVGIVFIQMVLVSTIIGYIVSGLQKLFINIKMSYLLIIPFLFFPIILNNLYPLRLTIYSFLELLIIYKLISLHFNIDKVHNKYIELTLFSLLITLLCFWRAEGIYYIILVPYIVYKLNFLHNLKQEKILGTIGGIAIPLVILSTGYLINKATEDPSYQLSIFINPLSTMIQHDLKGEKISENLSSIDKVIDIDILKKYPSFDEIPAFWREDNLIINYSQNDLKRFYKSYAYIVVNNLAPFLNNRMNTFLSTNNFYPATAQVNRGSQIFSTKDSHSSEVINSFLSHNYLSKPININIKTNATRFLLMIDNNNHNTILSKFIWSVIPTIFMLLIATIYLLFNKSYYWVLIVCIILARVPLLFITAPASLFMYYLPVYMSGNFIIALLLILHLDKNSYKK